jgi:hypothetical protein
MIDKTLAICEGLVMLIIGGILFFYYRKRKAGYMYQEERRLKNIYRDLKTPEMNKVDILGAVTGFILFLGAFLLGGGILLFILSLSKVLQFAIAIFVIFLFNAKDRIIFALEIWKDKKGIKKNLKSCGVVYRFLDFGFKFGDMIVNPRVYYDCPYYIRFVSKEDSSSVKVDVTEWVDQNSKFIKHKYKEDYSAVFKDRDLQSCFYIGEFGYKNFKLFFSPFPIDTENKRFKKGFSD